MKRYLIIACLLLVFFPLANAQLFANIEKMAEIPPPNTRPEHSWQNLLSYIISVTPDYDNKKITGSNTIEFVALQPGKTLYLHLDGRMRITSIAWNKSTLEFKRDSEGYFVYFPQQIPKDKNESITVYFEGQPREAINAPSDNGWIWARDKKGRPWMSIGCQGSGASIWLPCKEVLYDEPDHGVTFNITVPDSLIAVANGRLQQKRRNKNKTITYTWKVINRINNYNIIPYIGKYVTWSQNFKGENGKLDCHFYALDYNLEKAKRHWQQTDTMLRVFEHWMGAYPFYLDGYKLVEAPMQGMEHQSAISYGNGFQNGFNGKDLFGTGWGLKWDFILVHESGHEWFGNNITTNNHGDTWIHEGFTKYSETLYTDFVFGTQAGNEYAIGTWKRIKNDQPVVGTNTTDKYYKGSAMLHMIRQITGDSAFRNWLRSLNRDFHQQTINTGQVLQHLNEAMHQDYTALFNQYLKTIQVPVLEYAFQNNTLKYRWIECVQNFDMPVKVSIDEGASMFIYPTTQWKELSLQNSAQSLKADNNFYVRVKAQ
jgi:aminopeptidase N